MAQPTWLDFASDSVFTGGSEVGNPVRVTPGAGFLEQGFVPGLNFGSEGYNYYLHNVSEWTEYLKNLDTDAYFLGQDYTWTGIQKIDGAGAGTGELHLGDAIVYNQSGVAGAQLWWKDGYSAFAAFYGDAKARWSNADGSVWKVEIGSSGISTNTGVGCSFGGYVNTTDHVKADVYVGSAGPVYAGAGTGEGFRLTSDGSAGGETYDTRTRTMPSAVARPGTTDWIWNISGVGGDTYWEISAPGTAIPLDCLIQGVPRAAKIVSVEAHVDPGSAAGTEDMFVELVKYGSGGSGSSVASSGGDASGTSGQWLTATMTSPETVSDDYAYYVRVWSSNSGAASDVVNGFRVTFRDYGPGVIP